MMDRKEGIWMMTRSNTSPIHRPVVSAQSLLWSPCHSFPGLLLCNFLESRRNLHRSNHVWSTVKAKQKRTKRIIGVVNHVFIFSMYLTSVFIVSSQCLRKVDIDWLTDDKNIYAVARSSHRQSNNRTCGVYSSNSKIEGPMSIQIFWC